ncbi:hypothetical protein SAMN05518801_12228 [Novosphingobium sp. CF614]|uniref:hypothetical protein n=1 Tax=Novosphingobium sp. CF614 TaxID=1884364 RepID=UPI0008DF579A|nr:hypothetical protein [Novosphingobium sp. CF614]SFG39888.1 hypothetical protein SAMN05518801_12228 [Novosphingobium sp. CF614]
MISAFLLALATLSGPAAAPDAAYASDTIRHLKGHPSLPAAPANQARKTANAACHPDPGKGRVCRHRQAQADETSRELLARTEADGTAPRETAR